MARIKPENTAPVLKSLEEADSALAQLAALRRNVFLIETGMNDEIDGIKFRAAQEAEPYKTEISGLEQALSRYADYNKAELFARRKSLDLTFGSIGYRASTKTKLLAKMTWERVLQNLRDNNLADCIRVKAEPDKEAIKGLAPELIKEVGCKVVQEDTFFYDLAEQALGSDVGEAV